VRGRTPAADFYDVRCVDPPSLFMNEKDKELKKRGCQLLSECTCLMWDKIYEINSPVK
jgi:hypothetical protein